MAQPEGVTGRFLEEATAELSHKTVIRVPQERRWEQRVSQAEARAQAKAGGRREQSLFPEVAQFIGVGARDTAREEAGAVERA